MRTIRTSNNTAARSAFTLIELMVVVVIIAIAVAISTTAYLRAAGSSQTTTAKGYLQSLAGAIQFYYQEQRDYPAMRYNDVISNTSIWPDHSASQVPNAEQSVEAMVYCLQYRSGAGKALSSLPTSVFRQGKVGNVGDTVTEAGQARSLYVVYDPWGNPIQYVRPRTLPVTATADQIAKYPLSGPYLNNRVLLISMGPDGVPGNIKDPTNTQTWYQDTYDSATAPKNRFPNYPVLGTGDDIVVEVGAAQ